MVILYTVKNGQYIDIQQLQSINGIAVYVNLTNRCSCHCTFCLRQTKEMTEQNSLWLKEEPTVQQVLEELQKYPIEQAQELVFCGFGEPLLRVEEVIEISKYSKSCYPTLPIRINTNGLSSKSYGKDITPLFKNLIDVVSISLNAPTKEEYYALTRSQFGIESFGEMLDFTKKCKQYVPKVILSVVDIIGEDKIQASKTISEGLGVTLRVRPFEE